MSNPPRPIWLPSPIIALAGWIVPGAGYMLIGEKTRGLIVLFTILALYGLGILVAGVRVIEVPGYNKNGYRTQMIGVPVNGMMQVKLPLFEPANLDEQNNPPHRQNEVPLGWSMSNRFTSEVANKPWIVPQLLTGPLAMLGAWGSIAAAQAGVARVHAPLETVGTLYTAIAGMLNLYIIIDATSRASSEEN